MKNQSNTRLRLKYLDYNKAMNDVNAIRKRLLKYVGPCLLLAVLFNIPKFFEAKVVYKTENMQPSINSNQTIVCIDYLVFIGLNS